MAKTETALMKLIFRVGGIGFSLTIEHLIEVLNVSPGMIDTAEADTETGLYGHVPFRDEAIPVYFLGSSFGLQQSGMPEAWSVLVLVGGEGPWGAVVDGVEGVFAETDFVCKDLPVALSASGQQLYTNIDLWRGEPLVCCEPYRIDSLRVSRNN